VIPLLLAASPVPVNSSWALEQPVQVQSFDPVARAALLAQQLPRQWSGTYQAFSNGVPVAVQVKLASATAIGQMVDVRGEMTLGSITLPIQGNLNANSDQLDLLLLGDVPGVDLEPGGRFLGLQGFTLTGWRAQRLTNPGGVLVLNPVLASTGAPTIRGLW